MNAQQISNRLHRLHGKHHVMYFSWAQERSFAASFVSGTDIRYLEILALSTACTASHALCYLVAQFPTPRKTLGYYSPFLNREKRKKTQKTKPSFHFGAQTQCLKTQVIVQVILWSKHEPNFQLKLICTEQHLKKIKKNIEIAHQCLAELTILPKELLTRSAKNLRTENVATKLPFASIFTTLNNYCFKRYLVVKSLNLADILETNPFHDRKSFMRIWLISKVPTSFLNFQKEALWSFSSPLQSPQHFSLASWMNEQMNECILHLLINGILFFLFFPIYKQVWKEFLLCKLS